MHDAMGQISTERVGVDPIARAVAFADIDCWQLTSPDELGDTCLGQSQFFRYLADP